MTRKLFLAAALVLTLTSAIGIGTAQASWGGHPGWVYDHGWGPRYYSYYVPYYVGPHCFVTVYGTATCY